MLPASNLDLDVVIFGGGCAGLWLLDDLRRRGARVLLLEARALGSGQTASAQGILHGGLKYSLAGILSASASAVRDMPAVWERSLRGECEPDLSSVRLREDSCYLWRSASLLSWAGMLGAVAALAVRPVEVTDEAVPPVLANCPRPVYRLDERVIDPVSFLAEMARRNEGLIWKVDHPGGVRFERAADGTCPSIVVRNPASSQSTRLRPAWIALAAGAGNGELREQLGLSASVMQRRPLRVGLVRGKLPRLNGHCVEGAKTRLTITSDVAADRRTVWQLGGQVSEDGVHLEPREFLRHARRELAATLPGLALDGLEWATYTVDRAERATGDGAMPGDVQTLCEGHVLTAWPTKLVLAPRLTHEIIKLIDPRPDPGAADWPRSFSALTWPAPRVARPPWEEEHEWMTDV
jgi:glycine/D-amino acid oxidase-like deaminating enzyme